MPSRRLEDLRPMMESRARAWLAGCEAAGLEVLIYCTLRSLEEQAGLYAQGRSRPGPIVTWAPPGSSAHNHGLAFDFVPLVGGKPLWTAPTPRRPVPQWLEAVDIAARCDLESASTWTRHREWPHLQMPSWRDYLPSSWR